MKFIESFQELKAKLEENRTVIVIFVDSNVLIPSESLLKYFSTNPIVQQLENHIYIFKNVDKGMYEQYKVFQFPQVTVIKQAPHNVLFSFVGCNQEKSTQALEILCESLGIKKPRMKLNIQKKYCPAQHQMQFINEIDESLYRNGCFQCNFCNKLSHVDSDKPMFHCGVCLYDLCYSCIHTYTIN